MWAWSPLSAPPHTSAGLEFDRWLNTPGWPPFLPDLSPGQQLMKPADELAELWASDGLNVEEIEAVDISAWKTYQLVYFLDRILQKSPLPDGEAKATSRASMSCRDCGWEGQLRSRSAQLTATALQRPLLSSLPSPCASERGAPSAPIPHPNPVQYEAVTFHPIADTRSRA